MAGNAGEPLTWPPRGRWSRTVPDSSEAGLLALSNFQRNQSLISPPECNRINRLMTAQDPTKPAGDKPSVRMITVPADRAGQRLDNFLLGQLKGAPRSLVYKLVRSGQV
ncbi:23S rRNA pseudouridine(955/2504/2580) synthase, partial [Stenotrophomonas sp. HMWF022]